MESVASLLCPSLLPSPSLSPSQNLLAPSFSFPSFSFKSLSIKPKIHLEQRRKERAPIAARAASSGESSPSSTSSEIWLLEPVGDGDSRHIGYKVPLPGAFEMASNVVTVGRVPEKADIVIPVATVSGLHARLEKKEGNLLVTDLDSTNGTFVNEIKLTPGAVTKVPPGSYVTFGDTNLAIFRVSKVEMATTSPSTEGEEPVILNAVETSDNLDTLG